MTDLRDHALRTLERLEAGEIEVQEAAAVGKLSDSVVNTVKSQMEYSKMTAQEPQIPFIYGDQNLIEGTVSNKKYLNDK